MPNIISVLAGAIGICKNRSREAQKSYNEWFRIAEVAQQIKQEPERAAELAGYITGYAEAICIRIIAHSKHCLGYVIESPSSGEDRN